MCYREGTVPPMKDGEEHYEQYKKGLKRSGIWKVGRGYY